MLGFYAVVLLSIGLWPLVWSWQWIVQLSLALFVIGLAVIEHNNWQSKPVSWPHLNLSDDGAVDLSQGEDWLPAKVSYRSVSCDWFCLLVLERQTLMEKPELIRIWLFRDGVDENSYRRLCRVIHRMRASG